MLQIYSPIMFTLVAILLGGWVFSKEENASMGDICQGGALFGGILSCFFVGVTFL
jgi:hypothetical protein